MWTRHHASVFMLTFFSFSLFHSARKTFSNIKDGLSKEWTPTSCNATWPCPLPCQRWSSHDLFNKYDDAEPFLGLLDTVFLFSYAVGLFISGMVGERFDLRKVLAIGMWLSGLTIFIFGTLTQWLHFYNKAFYIVIWCLNGFFQSTGWPCSVAIIGNWFGKSGRGFIFGIWSSNASFGNIFGSLIASTIVDYGYEVVFLYASTSLFCGGIIAYFSIISSPTELGLEDPNIVVSQPEPANDLIQVDYDSTNQQLEDEHSYNVDDEVTLINQGKPKRAIAFFKALLLPGVIGYSLSFASLKMVNYGMFIWLPYYFTNNFQWSDSTADRITVWYDIGSIAGGIFFGLISDRTGQRAPVLFAMLIFAPFALLGYQKSPNNVIINSLLLFVVGVFVGGASNIIGTAVTADIGKQEEVGQDTEALATVTGIIDGTGSIGAGIGQYLIALIQIRLGWEWVFYFFILAVICTLISLTPMFIKDLKTSGFWKCNKEKLSLLFKKKQRAE